MTNADSRRRVLLALAVPVAIALAGQATASADPGQPGLDSPTTEQAGVTDQPTSTADWEYLGGINPNPQFEDAPTQPVPSYTRPLRTYAAPVRVAPERSAPATVTEQRVAPVQAAPDTLRLGANVIERPGWLPRDLADQTNNTFAVIEASGDTALRNAGVDAPRADRVAAGSLAGGAIGGAVAATAVGVPAVALSAGGGALIGAATGAAVTAPVAAVAIPVVGSVPGAAAGAAAGALVGAAAGAAAATPIVVGAFAAGAVVGGIAGGAFAAGSEPDPSQPAAPNSQEPKANPTTPEQNIRLSSQVVIHQVDTIRQASGFDAAVASAQQATAPLAGQVADLVADLHVGWPR